MNSSRAEITYREEKPDPHRFFELFETTGWNSTYAASEKELEAALNNSWYSVAAYEGDELVGFGRVVSDEVLHAMIYDLIVKPSHQGRGIGTAVLRMLVEKCRSAGVRDIQLFSAKGKAGFYSRRGFQGRPADAPGMQLAKE